MVSVDIEDSKLVLEMQGMDKLWSLRSTLRIPLSHVKAAVAAEGAERGLFEGFRIAGTFIPGLLTAGTFYQKGGFVFWDVHNSENAIRITLEHERYQELVVEVENPSAAVHLINNAIGAR